MQADMTTILQALQQHDHAIAAWEVDSDTDPTLSVFDVSGDPAQLTYVSVAPADVAEASQQLLDAGHVPGFYATGADMVWRTTTDSFGIWCTDGAGLKADGTVLKTKFDEFAAGNATGVVPFVGDDGVTRGVKLRVGSDVTTVAMHHDHNAASDTWYGDAGWKSIAWVSTLSQQLAEWLKVDVDDAGPAA